MVAPYSVLLTDNSGTTPLTLVPTENDNGTRAYREFRLPSLSPRTTLSEDQVSFAQVPPEQELVWDQRDWSKGQGEFYYADGFYAESDGVEARKNGEISVGMEIGDGPNISGSEFDFASLDWNAENTGGTGWFTSVAGTASEQTATVHTGARAWQITADADGEFEARREILGFPSTTTYAFRNREFTLTARVRSGDGTAAPRISLSGDISGKTFSSATTSQTFVELSVTKTFGTADTVILAGLESSTVPPSGTNGQVAAYWDSMSFIPTGGAETVDAVEFQDDLYVAAGRMILKWSPTAETPLIQYLATSATVTSLGVYDDTLFAAIGNTTNAVLSSSGDVGSFAQNTTTPFKAQYLARLRNANGEWALARAYNNSTRTVVALTTTAKDAAPVWSTDYVVGDNDFAFTGLHEFQDGIWPSKEDGLYRYERFVSGTAVPSNAFASITPEGRVSVSSDNFKIALSRGRWLYAAGGETSLVRYGPDGNSEDLTRLLESSDTSFGSKVVAMTQDWHHIYIVVEEPGAVNTSKKHRLLSLEDNAGNLIVHTIATLNISEVSFMVRYSKNILVFGRHSADDTANRMRFSGYRILAPVAHRIPRMDNTPRMELRTVTLDSGFMDWNSPDVEKSFNTLTLLSEDLSTASTAIMGYKIDGDTGFTNLATTYTSSPSQTVAFPSGTTGRRIKLRYSLKTSASNATPVVRAHVLRASWRPKVLRAWEFTSEIVEGGQGGPGGAVSGSVSEVLSTLRTLEEKVSPIKITPLDTDTPIDGHIRNVESFDASHTLPGGQPTIRRMVKVRIEEALTS